MEEFADRRARGFSQGQRVKTALARALVHRPRNLVLDEPTNGLDVMAVRALRSLLRQLRDAGHCVLLSSHVMQEVSALCDEVVVIAAGAVRASGTPEVIRARTGTASLEEAFVQLIGEPLSSAQPCAPSSYVFAKEFRENLRERRTLFTALLLGPLLAPLLFAGALSLQLQRGAEEGERPLTLAVAHAERAPNLLAFLRQYGVAVTPVDYDDDAGARGRAGADPARGCCW